MYRDPSAVNAAQGPFMLWVDSFTPHEFFDPPRQFADAYYENPDVVDYMYPQHFQSRFKFSEEEIKRTQALYYGYCTFMDKWIGHLLKKLDDHKLWDNTVVILTSNNANKRRNCWRRNSDSTRLTGRSATSPASASRPGYNLTLQIC